jgi:inorganic triphosphatase YgiF
MEIEAKFRLPSKASWLHLQTIEQLAGYALGTPRVKRVSDAFLDTADRSILAAGYACRKRAQSEGVLVTLKSLGQAQGAIHRRDELEVLLPTDCPPEQWPDGSVRRQITQWAGNAPLEAMFSLSQVRAVRLASQGQRQVVELSVDEVHLSAYLSADHKALVYFVVEAELLPQGTEKDLQAIAHCLQHEWGLEAEPASKFEQAMAFLQERAA